MPDLWNVIQTVAIIVSAASAIVIYFRQRWQKQINAAILVKLDIDSVEKKINILKHKKGHSSVLQTEPIYQTLEWYNLRHLLVSRIGFEHIDKLNDFFASVVLLEEARKSFNEVLYQNKYSKIQATQQSIVKLLLEQTQAIFPVLPIEVKDGDLQPVVHPVPYNIDAIPGDSLNTIDSFLRSQTEMFEHFFGESWPECSPADIKVYYNDAIKNFIDISNTPAYEALKRAAKIKK